MTLLKKIDSLFGEKLMLLNIFSLFVGLFLPGIFKGGSSLLPYVLSILVMIVGTNCTLDSFRSIVRSPKSFIIALAIIYLLMPLIGYGIGAVFYPDKPLYAAGSILVSVTPVALTSMVWTGLAGGNLALALALVAVVTIFSGVNIPFQLSLFMGKVIEFDAMALTLKLIVTVVVPVLIGIGIRYFSGERIEKHRPVLGIITKVLMLVIMAVNGAVLRPYVNGLGMDALRLLLVAAFHMILNFSISMLIGAIFLGLRDPAIPPVVYASSMKNNAAGVVIALNYFSPAVALPVVFSMMTQQFWAGVFFQIFRRIRDGRS